MALMYSGLAPEVEPPVEAAPREEPVINLSGINLCIMYKWRKLPRFNGEKRIYLMFRREW